MELRETAEKGIAPLVTLDFQRDRATRLRYALGRLRADRTEVRYITMASAAKRILDVALVLLSSPVLLPLLLLIALLIKLDSPGPVLFTQRRIGRYGQIFRIFKFRTMYVNAEDRFASLSPDERLEFKRFGKIKDDPRVTRVGKWLRRLSLDEFPQIWNVLRGQMSLVGPRAYMLEQMPQVTNGHIIFLVRPGLTGLWQVSGRSALTFETRLRLDAKYVLKWSLGSDLVILWRTVRVVATGDGAY